MKTHLKISAKNGLGDEAARWSVFLWLPSAVAIVVAAMAGGADACPFCNAESQTLSEETRGADAVVLAKLLKEVPATANAADPNSGTATFQVVEVLRGKDLLKDAKEIGVVFFGDSNRERIYLVNGIGKDKVDWTTPLPLSAEAVKYVKQLSNVAPAGTDRLVFFQDYLENDDPLLRQDAYDEFARRAVHRVARAGSADEARSRGKMGYRSGGEPEPAAIVSDDAGDLWQ